MTASMTQEEFTIFDDLELIKLDKPDDLFPSLEHLSTMLGGRNVRAGTQRATALQLLDTPEKIRADPLYQYAARHADGRSLMHEHHRMNIYLILRYFDFADLPQGHIAEFGVYRGGNALFMAELCRELHPTTNIYAFDTFEGMPGINVIGNLDGQHARDFHNAQFDELQKIIENNKLHNLRLIKGRFEETAHVALPEIKKLRMSCIDPDLYESVKYSYDISKPYMADGGYWVFSGPLFSTCIGAMTAVEECVIRRDGRHAEQAYPHLVYRNL